METVQFKTVSGIIFAILISALIILAIFTWQLSRELDTLQNNAADTVSVPSNPALSSASGAGRTSLLSGSSDAPAAPVQSQQGGAASSQSNQTGTNPVYGSGDPLDNPWAGDWPGFFAPGSSFAEIQNRMDELDKPGWVPKPHHPGRPLPAPNAPDLLLNR